MTKKEPSEKQLAARKAFGDAARARAAAKRANQQIIPDKPVVDTSKSCIFCGQPAKYQRFVQLRTIPICEEHYYSETVGKIAEKLREKSNEGPEQTEEAVKEKEEVVA